MSESSSFLDRLGHESVLLEAWRDVLANRGVPGVDRVTVNEFAQNAGPRLAELAGEIRNGTYRPLPARRIRPAFLAASDRAIVVPVVRDRVVQRAIAALLGPEIEPKFSPVCQAYRRGHSASAAARQAGEWIAAGFGWVLRADIEKFFDSIQPEVVERQLEPYVDARSMVMLRRIIRTRVFDQDEVIEPVTGISQGSPLSPILSNLYLSESDFELAASHPRCLRYCDDYFLAEKDEATVRAGLSLLTEKLQGLGLTLNQRKTQVCRAEDGLVFLGFHFGAAGRGPATKAVEALRYRLASIDASEPLDLEEVDALHRGWTGYYGNEPEPWLDSPAGILALLRQQRTPPGDAHSKLSIARWRIGGKPSSQIALALAAAWTMAGLEANAWLEFARFHAGSKALVQVDSWARILGAQASSLTGLLSSLQGVPDDTAALAEAAAEAGRFEAAREIEGIGAAALGAGEARAEAVGPADEADLPLLLEWFQGRDGVHCAESVGRGGHRQFVPDHRPLSEEDWLAHLRGERTLALPLIRADQTVLLAVLDIDVGHRDLDLRLGVPDTLLGRALGMSLRLRAELTRAGAGSLLEFSGYKGYHLWVRFLEPVLAAQARRFLYGVLGHSGPVPEGVSVEVFPTRDRVRQEEVGPVIKLPLGVHGRTGRRCELLDERGRALAEPMEALRSVVRAPASLAVNAVMPEPPAEASPAAASSIPAGGPVAVPTATPTAALAKLEAPPSFGPQANRLIEGCGVLRAIVDKTTGTSYLNHMERKVLLCTLGHLGEEGAAALHGVISRTYNYRKEVTQRHIDRLPSFPISCPRIREILPELSAASRCSCQFHLRGRGYPTPLLFAMRPSEVPAFRRPAQPDAATPTAAPKGNMAKASPAEPSESLRRDPRIRDLEQALARVVELRRQLRGVTASLERAFGTLDGAFEALGTDEVQLPNGTLRRSRRADGLSWDYRIEV